jgi:hypothetical protein
MRVEPGARRSAVRSEHWLSVSLEFAADVAVTMLGGPATVSLSMVWGTTLILYGLALYKEGYSRALGWTGAIVGAVLFVMSITKFVRRSLFPGVILYGGGTWVVHLWALAVAIAVWRRARGLPAPSRTDS